MTDEQLAKATRLRDRGGRLTAACGLRAAGGGPVFLEHYLAGPVERAVAAVAEVPIARARVVEVGNLAVAPPGSARELIAALTEYLVPTPFQWVVFTGGPALRNAFLRLGVPLSHLAHARIDDLPEDARAHWGTYYDSGPTVCAVEVEASRAALARRAQHASASVRMSAILAPSRVTRRPHDRACAAWRARGAYVCRAGRGNRTRAAASPARSPVRSRSRRPTRPSGRWSTLPHWPRAFRSCRCRGSSRPRSSATRSAMPAWICS
jgi:hypothetical protein